MTKAQRAEGLAIITGASGGIGAAAARLMADAGWPLLLTGRDAERLEMVATPLRAACAAVETLAGDIAVPEFPKALIQALGERPLGAVIHTAGLSPSIASAERILQVNLDATVRLVAAVRSRMSPGGCVVLYASNAAGRKMGKELDAAFDAPLPAEGAAALLPLLPGPGPAYVLSKRAVIRLVEREAPAFGARGARIVSISPALIDTEMTRAESGEASGHAAMLATMPLGRLGRPEEAAAAAVFLCSPAASFISGTDLRVDGGSWAGMLAAGMVS